MDGLHRFLRLSVVHFGEHGRLEIPGPVNQVKKIGLVPLDTSITLNRSFPARQKSTTMKLAFPARANIVSGPSVTGVCFLPEPRPLTA
jgi:hypothetical protein